MTDRNETDNLINNVAHDVLTLARSTLMVRFRFLDIALNRLELVPSAETTLSTDGARLFYGPKYVLRGFKSNHDKPARDYLHVVLHCIFSHMFVGTVADPKLWDLACDIAVETTINDLGISPVSYARKEAQESSSKRLRDEVNLLTAEKIYHYYLETGISDYEAEMLRKLFSADDHSGWHRPKPADTNSSKIKDLSEKSSGSIDNEKDQCEAEIDDLQDSEDTWDMPVSDIEEDWKKIAEKIQEDLETFSREQGDTAGELMQNLNAANRERYDYTSFLKKFSVLGETVDVNYDEFDYIFYTYGLRLYENMPLVEPLEYKEVKRIREFIIAVDTSGSTSGELVQRFLQKTYNILKSTESYFSHINVHIIQCDAVIQEHVRITSEEDFDNYISSMTIRGLGGTDFRPVFEFVDRLIDEGEFRELKGLIYFTDGRGTYPSRKPWYETAFVFLDNEYNNPEVPPWAIRLVLQNEEI